METLHTQILAENNNNNNNNTLILKNACHASLNAFYNDWLKT